jgi:hypothetical protein
MRPIHSNSPTLRQTRAKGWATRQQTRRRKKMTQPRGRLAILLLGFLMLTGPVVNRALLVASLFPPQATVAQRIHLLFSTHHEIAVPHRGFFSQLRFTIIPSARAQSCSSPLCDSTTTKETCNPDCPGMCGNCPNCFNGPCTIYTCAATTTINRLCIQSWNTATCASCRLDRTTSQCTPQ